MRRYVEDLIEHSLNLARLICELRRGRVGDGHLAERRAAVAEVDHQRDVFRVVAAKERGALCQTLFQGLRGAGWDRREGIRLREKCHAVFRRL